LLFLWESDIETGLCDVGQERSAEVPYFHAKTVEYPRYQGMLFWPYVSLSGHKESFFLQFSLPMPKGGKHAVNPILCEDQPQPQFRAAKKALLKLNVFDPDYVAGNSPFLMNDLTSKASLLGRRGENTFCEMQPWMAKNPNACRRPRK
jgi:hypothetical protein